MLQIRLNKMNIRNSFHANVCSWVVQQEVGDNGIDKFALQAVKMDTAANGVYMELDSRNWIV